LPYFFSVSRNSTTSLHTCDKTERTLSTPTFCPYWLTPTHSLPTATCWQCLLRAAWWSKQLIQHQPVHCSTCIAYNSYNKTNEIH